MPAFAFVWMVTCISVASGYSQGSLRLRSSWTEDTGYVQILKDGHWLDISDNNWTEEDGTVACRQLGYSTLAGLPSPATLCPVLVEERVIDKVDCSGTEQQILLCNSSEALVSESTVIPSGISCSGELGVRLVNSNGDLARGELEVFRQEEWLSVCTEGFTSADSNAVCRQLGFDGGEWEPAITGSGAGSGGMFIQSIYDQSYVSFNSTCSMGELNLESCMGAVIVTNSCLATVQVQCFGPPYPTCPPVLVNVSCSGIQVAWQPPPLCSDHTSFCNITHYVLRYRLAEMSVNASFSSASHEWQLVEASSQSVLQLGIMGLEPGSVYEIQLRAVNAHGNGTYSNSLWASTLPPVLPVPRDVTVTVTSAGSTNISWEVDVDCSIVTIIGFWVSYTTTNSSLQQELITGGAAREAAITGLQASSEYWFSIEALGCVSEGGCVMLEALRGVASKKVWITTPFPDFSFSVNFTVSEREFYSVAINVSWQLDSDPSVLADLVGYTVACSDDNNSSQSSKSILSNSLVSINSGNLVLPVQASMNYSCIVIALVIGGNELKSASRDISTPETVPLTQPTALAVTDIGSDRFLFHWQFTGIGPPGSFLVEVISDNYTIQERVITPAAIPGDQYTYEHPVTGLFPGRTYLASVAGSNSAGSGPFASTVVTTRQRVPSCPPTHLTHQSSSVIGDSLMISLTWQSPTPKDDDVHCTETILGYSLQCIDRNTMAKLSQVTLAMSDSQQNFTAEVTVSEQLRTLLSGLNCTVAAFNSAGEGISSEQVFINLTLISVNMGGLENSFLANPQLSLAFLIVMVALFVLVCVLLSVFCIFYICTQRCCKRKKDRHLYAATSTANIYHTSEPTEESYIPMAASSILNGNQQQRRASTSEQRSYWIDLPQLPQVSTFSAGPDHEDQQQSSGSGLVISREEVERGTNTFLSDATEEDPYDEVVPGQQPRKKERTATDHEQGRSTETEIGSGDPKTVKDEDKENVYDEIVSVARIPEASSTEKIHLPPLENGLSQTLSQDTELLPAIPPPREFSGLPTRRSTSAAAVYSHSRRPAPLPPEASTRRMTTGARPSHRARVSDVVSGKSSKPPLILVNRHLTQQTDEVAYSNITLVEESTTRIQGLLSNREQNENSSPPPSSPQYEVLVHPKSLTDHSQSSADALLTPEVINASYDTDDTPTASS